MPAPTRIADTFRSLKAEGRMAFMPFIACGDPDMPTTVALLRELAARGVDLIEVGFPYSDPIADGPVIQASYTRALNKGLHVADIFAGIRDLTRAGDKLPPLVAMVAYSLVFRNGTDAFLNQAAEAGFAGLIIPDLPGDEAGDLKAQAHAHGLDLIQLVAPTTPPERVERILKAASGFVYCISIAGTTGVRTELPPELSEQLKWLRTKTDLPLAVGFGISRPEQVDTLRGLADGVIVGSAVVKQLEPLAAGTADRPTFLLNVVDFAAAMVKATQM